MPTTTNASPDRRKLAIRAARKLMLTHSYLGLSLQELADDIGIRKASLYYHFPSKEALGSAIVDDSLQRFRQWSDDLAGETPERQILAYIHLVRDTMRPGVQVCPIGATAGEWDRVESEVQQSVVKLHRLIVGWLEKAAGKLDPAITAAMGFSSPKEIASHVTALCQGALLSARLHRDPALFDLAVEPFAKRLQPPS